MKHPVIVTIYMISSMLMASAYGMILILPLRIISIGGTEANVGDIQLTAGGMSIITVIFSGRICDILGQLGAMSLAALLISFSLILFAVSNTVGMSIGFAAIIFGIGWGIFFAGKLVVLARITSREERFRLYAFLAIAIMTGYGLSPVAGAAIEELTGDIRHPFLLTACACIVSAVLYFFLRAPIRSLEDVKQKHGINRLQLADIRDIFHSDARKPIILTFLSACVFSGMSSFQTVFASENELNYSNWFLSYTVIVIVVRLPLSNYVTSANANHVVTILFAIMLIAVGLFSTIEQSPLLYVCSATLFGIGYGVASPIVQTMGANLAAQNLMPQTLQVLVLAHLFGVFGFPMVAGRILIWQGTETLVLSLLIFSIFTLIAALASRPFPFFNSPKGNEI